jgi:predicted metallo-beta-lactamase superfamily hydrolase
VPRNLPSATLNVEIIGAESMGVRGLCCLVSLPGRRIVIDPGIALGYLRKGLQPHPVQIAVGRSIREKILAVLNSATDVVFSHFHGDHVPLLDANPYQLSIQSLPQSFRKLRCWTKSDEDLNAEMRKRADNLRKLLGTNMHDAEGSSDGPLSFSPAVPHGAPESSAGTLMMTRIQNNNDVFVHASDIQLLDNETVDLIIDWQPDIVLAAGPPLYLDQLSKTLCDRAWGNAVRLAKCIDVVILDHHLMRDEHGAVWLDDLSATVGKKVYCAADFMGCPRRLLEAERAKLYEHVSVPAGWHDDYAKGRVGVDNYLNILAEAGS